MADKILLNKRSLITTIFDRTGIKLAPQTLWKWQKRGILKPSALEHNGKQLRPLYDTKVVDFIVKKIQEAKDSGRKKIMN